MPYREKKIYSGKILEIEMYPITEIEKNQSRKKKEKYSSSKQKNLNDKNAKKHLIRLLNTNFTDQDLAVHLTYNPVNTPQSEEEAKRDITNYIRRLKHYRKKHNLTQLKYVAVFEYKEPEEKLKAVRMHHHIIINGGMDRDTVEKLWDKGRANADRLKADENQYEALARYISKDPKGNRRWTQSKNLKQPTVKVNDSKYSMRKVEKLSTSPEDREQFERLYPDYLFNDCKVEVNEVTAGTYLYIKMRKRGNTESEAEDDKRNRDQS